MQRLPAALDVTIKNALDWGSRPYGQTVFKDKPVAIVGTSPLPTGAASALADVAKVLTLIGADVVAAELAVSAVHTRFDDKGRFADEELAEQIDALLISVAGHVTRQPLPDATSGTFVA